MTQRFVDTSEFAYLSTLCKLQDKLLSMLGEGKFSDAQLKELLPVINYANEILNLPREELSKEPNKMN